MKIIRHFFVWAGLFNLSSSSEEKINRRILDHHLGYYPEKPPGRIIGGTDVAPNSIPFQVRLINISKKYDQGNNLCAFHILGVFPIPFRRLPFLLRLHRQRGMVKKEKGQKKDDFIF